MAQITCPQCRTIRVKILGANLVEEPGELVMDHECCVCEHRWQATYMIPQEASSDGDE